MTGKNTWERTAGVNAAVTFPGIFNRGVRSGLPDLRRYVSREGGEAPRLVLTLTDVPVFADGFESGDVSAWSAVP